MLQDGEEGRLGHGTLQDSGDRGESTDSEEDDGFVGQRDQLIPKVRAVPRAMARKRRPRTILTLVPRVRDLPVSGHEALLSSRFSLFSPSRPVILGSV